MEYFNYLDAPFTTFQNALPSKIIQHNPLGDIDISEWASEITPSGTPIVKPSSQISTPQLNFENTSEYQTTGALQYETKYDLSGNKKRAMEFFLSKGLKAHQAAGLVGNLLAESNLNPTAVNPTSKAYGIAQWLGDRKKKLISKYGEKPTFDLQLEFIWEELNTSEKHSLDELILTLTFELATNSFMKNFERPSKAEMAKSIHHRLKFGRELLS